MHICVFNCNENFFYVNCYRKQVQITKDEASRDGVMVPTTVEQYTVTSKPKPSESSCVDMGDFYDDDYMEDEDDDEDIDNYLDDDSDSGNGES